MSTVTGKRSKAALKAFLETGDDTDAQATDPRSSDLQSLDIADSAAVEIIREVFAGTGLPEDLEKVRRILRTRSEIRKEWGDARDSFLAIGRALIALENDLTRAEFARLRHGTERLFPFSDATATQLRQIARAVDGGRIPLQSCPGSYGTAYQIALLTEPQLEVARDRGLIRSDVTRREIVQLRREVSGGGAGIPITGRLNRSKLREERVRLDGRRMRLAEELKNLERRIFQLDKLLSPLIEGEAEGSAQE